MPIANMSARTPHGFINSGTDYADDHPAVEAYPHMFGVEQVRTTERDLTPSPPPAKKAAAKKTTKKAAARKAEK